MIACEECKQPIGWVAAPTGGWWAHVDHPTDDHPAVPSDDVAPQTTILGTVENTVDPMARRHAALMLAKEALSAKTGAFASAPPVRAEDTLVVADWLLNEEPLPEIEAPGD